MPPPVPVDSIFGVLKLVVLPKRSATTVENGYTVDEPTILMTSRPLLDEVDAALDAGCGAAAVFEAVFCVVTVLAA